MRPLLVARTTAATMRGLRRGTLPSQLSGNAPLRMIHRIRLMARTTSCLDIGMPHFAYSAEADIAANQSLSPDQNVWKTALEACLFIRWALPQIRE